MTQIELQTDDKGEQHLVVKVPVADFGDSSSGKTVKVCGTNSGKGGTERFNLPNGAKVMLNVAAYSKHEDLEALIPDLEEERYTAP